MKISPARRIRGTLRLPGDKSISHRAALLAAVAKGRSHLSNFSTSRDCASTLACLRQLGVSIERDGSDAFIDSDGQLHAPKPPGYAGGSDTSGSKQWLDCGNSGSTMRMLAGMLAGHDFAATLTGDYSLRSRPMKRIIKPLELMGARISATDAGTPPLSIEGRKPLKPITYELPIASAQIKTAVLFAGLFADGRTAVREVAGATRDHTERLLEWFGAPIEISDAETLQTRTCVVAGPADLAGRDVSVPGDFSSAAFFIAAAALLPGSALEIRDVGLNPTRTQLLETMCSMGARIAITESRDECNEPRGTLRIEATDSLHSVKDGSPISIAGRTAAALIDELPLLAVVGTQIANGLVIRDARELRYKETDRIAATVKNLRAMGAEVEEFEDGLAVPGPVRLHGVRLEAYGDHRIAMAFSVAALLAEGDSEISGSECVGISFPEFFECLEAVTER